MIHFLFVITLLITAAADAATKKIHNLFPLFIILLATVRILCNPALIPSRIAGFFVLSIPMLLLTQHRGGLGGGEIKLTAACGLFLGADAVLTGCFLASLLALALHPIRKLYAKRKHQISPSPKTDASPPFAFGPYLSAGYILASFL